MVNADVRTRVDALVREGLPCEEAALVYEALKAAEAERDSAYGGLMECAARAERIWQDLWGPGGCAAERDAANERAERAERERDEARNDAYALAEAATEETRAWLDWRSQAQAAEVVRDRYKEALERIGGSVLLADGDFGRELRARQDIARAAIKESA